MRWHRRRWSACVAALIMVLLPSWLARADTLVADLSDHLIAITTALVGTTVVLFGTTEPDADVAVTVIGPRENQVVRHKERIAGEILRLLEDGRAYARMAKGSSVFGDGKAARRIVGVLERALKA